MILGFDIFDSKKDDVNSEEFKNKIADVVKQLILQDWDKVAHIEQYEEMKDGEKAYRTIVELWREGDYKYKYVECQPSAYSK